MKKKRFIKKPAILKALVAALPKKEPPLPEGHIRTLSRDNILPYLASFLLIAASVLVFIIYRSYAWSAFIAVLLYVGFQAINHVFLYLFRQNRNLAAIITTLSVIIIVLGPITLLIRHLIRELLQLIKFLNTYLAGDEILLLIQKVPLLTNYFTAESFFWVRLVPRYKEFMGEYVNFHDTDKIGDWLSNAYNLVSGGLSITASLIINILFGIIILFFLFRDGPQFFSFITDALPFPRVIILRFVNRMREIIFAVILGNVFVSILQGAAISLGLLICGIPNPILYGVIAGIFSLIPIVGTSVVWLPVALYLAIIESSYGFALFISLWSIFFYLLLENILKPKLLDKKLGIHPLFLFLAILGGITEFGITGAILGPLIVTLFMTIWSIYHIWGASSANSIKLDGPVKEKKA